MNPNHAYRCQYSRCANAQRIVLLLILFQVLLPTSTQADANEQHILLIGVRADAPPFSMKSTDQEKPYKGYTVSLCDRIAKRAVDEGLFCDAKYVEVTAANRFEMLREEQIHLLCGASTITLERSRIADFSLMTFLSGASLMHLEPFDLPKDGTDGVYRIGVLEGTTTEEHAKKMFQHYRHNLALDDKASRVVLIDDVKDHMAGLKKLMNREIDLYLADREILLSLRKLAKQRSRNAQATAKTEIIVSDSYFTVEPYAIGVAANQRELRYLTNRTLNDLFNWENAKSRRTDDIFNVLSQNFPNTRFNKSLEYLFRLQRLPLGIPLTDAPPRKYCR